MTFKQANKQIFHTRFSVNNSGNVVDSYGKEHPTIASLAEWFANKNYENKTVPAAGYIMFNVRDDAKI